MAQYVTKTIKKLKKHFYILTIECRIAKIYEVFVEKFSHMRDYFLLT